MLPSQAAQATISRGSGMMSRSSRQPMWVFALVLIAIAGTGGLCFLLFRDHPANVQGGPTAGTQVAGTEHATPAGGGGNTPGGGGGATPVGAALTGGRSNIAAPSNNPGSGGAGAATPAPRLDPGPAQTTGPLADQVQRGLKLVADPKSAVDGRALLSSVLTNANGNLSGRDAQAIRDTLTSVNQELVFSPRIVQGDPLVESYTFAEGDRLARLAIKYKTTYQLIAQINNVDPNTISANRRLKIVKGPFHAVIHKAAFRIDIFNNGADGKPVYIESFPVGLGQEDSTPIGAWAVSNKVVDPPWTHPKTGQHFKGGADDNPLGHFWIALTGVDDATKNKHGYGIHGTIDPDSVGKQMSLGCIRLRAKDIDQVYRLLVANGSTVLIEP